MAENIGEVIKTSQVVELRSTDTKGCRKLVKDERRLLTQVSGQKELKMDLSPELVIRGSDLVFYDDEESGKVAISCLGYMPAGEAEREAGFVGTPIRWMKAVLKEEAEEFKQKYSKAEEFFDQEIKPSLENRNRRNLTAVTHGWGGSGLVALDWAGKLVDEDEILLSISGLGSEGMLRGENYEFKSGLEQIASALGSLESENLFGVDVIKDKLKAFVGHSMGGWEAINMAIVAENEWPQTKFVAMMPVVNHEKEHLKLLYNVGNGTAVSTIGKLPGKIYGPMMEVGDKLGANKIVFESFFNKLPGAMTEAVHRESLLDTEFILNCTRMLRGADVFNLQGEKIGRLARKGRLVMVIGGEDKILGNKDQKLFAKYHGIQTVIGKESDHYPDENTLRQLKEQILG